MGRRPCRHWNACKILARASAAAVLAAQRKAAEPAAEPPAAAAAVTPAPARKKAPQPRKLTPPGAPGLLAPRLARPRLTPEAQRVRLFAEDFEWPDGGEEEVIDEDGCSSDACIALGLMARLQPHQLEGVRFMWRTVAYDGRGRLLAHIMGLGKTLQSLATLHTAFDAHERRRAAGRLSARARGFLAILIVPAAVLMNWMAEFKTWLDPLGFGLASEHVHLIDTQNRAAAQASAGGPPDTPGTREGEGTHTSVTCCDCVRVVSERRKESLVSCAAC